MPKVQKVDIEWKFPENLKRIRKQVGYTQEYLARKMNCRAGTIASWELGRRAPHLKVFQRLTEVLGGFADDLLD